jgi:hypothetical protein
MVRPPPVDFDRLMITGRPLARNQQSNEHLLWQNRQSAQPATSRGNSCVEGAMPDFELWIGRWKDDAVTLTASSYTIGSDPESVDIALEDTAVSSIHLALERVGTAWLVRDVGSRNGTRVNGERLTGQRRLRDRDEINVGRTNLVFRDGVVNRRPKTDALAAPPEHLTAREKQVLIALCRPLLLHNTFQQPASVREIAASVHTGKNAVQAHLTNLFVKFGIHEQEGVNRRVVLANEAIQRGVVTIADLEADFQGESNRP